MSTVLLLTCEYRGGSPEFNVMWAHQTGEHSASGGGGGGTCLEGSRHFSLDMDSNNNDYNNDYSCKCKRAGERECERLGQVLELSVFVVRSQGHLPLPNTSEARRRGPG